MSLLMTTITTVITVIRVCPAAVESADVVVRRMFCNLLGSLHARVAHRRPGARRDVAVPVRTRSWGAGSGRTEGAAPWGRRVTVKYSQENINTSNRRLAELLSFSIHFLLKNAMELFILLRRKKLKIRL